jgi:hypothetical protein
LLDINENRGFLREKNISTLKIKKDQEERKLSQRESEEIREKKGRDILKFQLVDF